MLCKVCVVNNIHYILKTNLNTELLYSRVTVHAYASSAPTVLNTVHLSKSVQKHTCTQGCMQKRCKSTLVGTIFVHHVLPFGELHIRSIVSAIVTDFAWKLVNELQ